MKQVLKTTITVFVSDGLSLFTRVFFALIQRCTRNCIQKPTQKRVRTNMSRSEQEDDWIDEVQHREGFVLDEVSHRHYTMHLSLQLGEVHAFARVLAASRAALFAGPIGSGILTPSEHWQQGMDALEIPDREVTYRRANVETQFMTSHFDSQVRRAQLG